MPQPQGIPPALASHFGIDANESVLQEESVQVSQLCTALVEFPGIHFAVDGASCLEVLAEALAGLELRALNVQIDEVVGAHLSDCRVICERGADNCLGFKEGDVGVHVLVARGGERTA